MTRSIARTLLLSLPFTLLSACVGAPPSQLSSEGDVLAIVVEAPPGLAYRKVVEGARACYERMFDVAADYFPESHRGRVSAAMKTTFAMSTAFVVDIDPSGGGSAIRIVSHRSATGIPANVRKWLSGDYTACGLK